MSKISVNDVCRLCLTKDDLVWIFHKRLKNSANMTDVIYITTGVKITIKDIISQKICKKCCEVTIKMFEFRRTSLKNDKKLKEECNRHLNEKNIKIPNTEVTIKSKTQTDAKSENHKMKEQSLEPEKIVFTVHPSVQDLFKVYPQIKLPTVCLKAHITPFVSLQLNKVEDYFKKRNLDMHEHSKLVLRYSKAAARNSTVPVTSQTSGCSVSDNKSVQIDRKNKNSHENLVRPVKIIQRKPSYEVQSQRNNEVQGKQNHEVQSKQTHEVQNKQNNEARSKQSHEVPSKQNHDGQGEQSHDVQSKHIHETRGKQNHQIQSNPNHDTVSKNAGKSIVKNINLTNVNERVSEKSSECKKRKFSELENSSEKQSNKKPASVESTELVPNINVVPSTAATEPAVIVQSISVPLYICNICNSVQYSSKDLRKHKTKHLPCQFCKTLFRTVESKERHIESGCIIKNTMNNLPDVEVVKIEYNPNVRMKYSEAFVDFPPLEGVHNNLDNAKVSEPMKQTFEDVSSRDANTLSPANPLKSGISETAIEVIEIISDDEEPPMSSASNSISASIHKNSGKKVKERPVANANAVRTYSKKGKDGTIPVVRNAKVPTATQSIDNTVYNTVSIVKPDIRVRDNPILNRLDPRLPDMKILKELLLFKPLQLSAEMNVQTDFPSSQLVTVTKKDSSAEFQGLKPQLFVYKIPVIIKNGPLNVCYNSYTGAKQPKKLYLWNDLTPTDIKVNNITVQNSDQGSQPVEDSNNHRQNSNHSLSLSTYEEKTGGESTNVQLNNDSSTPIRPNDSSLVSNLPLQFVTTAPPPLIGINRNTIDDTLSFSSANVINMNPLLNNFLQTPVTTTLPPTISSTVVSASSTETIPCNNVVSFGTIRVKNVWELK